MSAALTGLPCRRRFRRRGAWLIAPCMSDIEGQHSLGDYGVITRGSQPHIGLPPPVAPVPPLASDRLNSNGPRATQGRLRRNHRRPPQHPNLSMDAATASTRSPDSPLARIVSCPEDSSEDVGELITTQIEPIVQRRRSKHSANAHAARCKLGFRCQPKRSIRAAAQRSCAVSPRRTQSAAQVATGRPRFRLHRPPGMRPAARDAEQYIVNSQKPHPGQRMSRQRLSLSQWRCPSAGRPLFRPG